MASHLGGSEGSSAVLWAFKDACILVTSARARCIVRQKRVFPCSFFSISLPALGLMLSKQSGINAHTFLQISFGFELCGSETIGNRVILRGSWCFLKPLF